MSERRRRILFFAETVTLAHVARPMVLAQSLDPQRYDVCVATNDRYLGLFNGVNVARQSIHCMAPDQFLDRLARGAPLFDLPTLTQSVHEDLAAIKAFSPDLIVGDLRVSLSVSARLAKIPYATITNAYWSPFAKLRLRVPEIAMVRFTGAPMAQAIFDVIRPLAFALHCLPMNRLRKAFGMPAIGWDVRQVYTDADTVLYADPAGAVPTHGLPSHHYFLGPVLWSPRVALPPWWDKVPESRPIVYTSLGSSGRVDLLPRIVEALAGLEVTIMAATAGRAVAVPKRSDVYLAEYLPGLEAAQRASVVVCNGGSPTTQQALAAGKPVLGIAANMDQLLNMESIVTAGAGLKLRPSQATVGNIRAAVARLLEERSFAAVASRLADTFYNRQDLQAPHRFPMIIDRLLDSPPEKDRSLHQSTESHEPAVTQAGL